MILEIKIKKNTFRLKSTLKKLIAVFDDDSGNVRAGGEKHEKKNYYIERIINFYVYSVYALFDIRLIFFFRNSV